MTYTPATTDDYKSRLFIDTFVFWVFNVAEECGDDGEVLWSSLFGVEGQGRDGNFINVGLGVCEGIVDEDGTGDERNTQHGGCCHVTGPTQKLSGAVEKRPWGA